MSIKPREVPFSVPPVAGAWDALLNAFKSSTDDGLRFQQEWLSFFNRRLEKDSAIFGNLLQCASLGVLIDLQTEYWSGLASDYAELVQRGLCWIGDTAQHSLDEINKAPCQTPA